MHDSYDLTTPEQVDLAYDVAGLGSRFIAAFIDSLIQFAVMVSLFVLGIAGGATLDRIGRRVLEGGDSTAAGVVLGLIVFAIFLVNVGYYIFFEMVWNGQSPGKRKVGLRVLTTGGHPITFARSLIRNLVRVVDMLPTSYMLGACVMLLNSRSQRLGDLAAGTLVVKERREAEPRILAGLPPERELPPQVASAFSADDVALARDFLLRRYELPPDRRHELAGRIAGRLRARLDPGTPPEPDESLLERVAALRR